MKCLDETAEDFAKRMRELAPGTVNTADADAIRRYASWIEAHPDAEEVQDLVRPPHKRPETRS
jgi:hypothetical protein